MNINPHFPQPWTTNQTRNPDENLKRNKTIHRGLLSRGRFHSLHMLTAAGLLLGGLGLATSRADILYLSVAAGKIFEFPPGGGVGSVFASTGLNNPNGLAFDRAGNLYVANFGDNTIEKFTSGGVGSVFANSSSGLLGPIGLAFDSAGNLYAANASTDSIQKFTSSGTSSVFASSSGTFLNSPQGLAFDSAGNLYAANLHNNTIGKITPGGVGSVFASTGLNSPDSLAFDRAGNLYVTNVGNNTIEKFSSTGVDLGVFINTGTHTPYGLAFDTAGNLYDSDNFGHVEKFSSTGTDLGTFASTPYTPSFLAFTDDSGVPLPFPNQVPELTLVSSRMTHGSAGTFDINLPLSGVSGIECRSASIYTVVFTFANTLTNVASVNTTATGGIQPGPSSGMIDPNDAHNYIANLTALPNAQYITVTLGNVSDSDGNFSSSVPAVMGLLIGDTGGNGSVNSADIGQTKAQSGNAVSSTNFREDVNVDGNINASDVGLVKSRSGTALP